MRVLMIANEYYPYPSAITNSFESITDEMIKNGYKIDVLTKRQNINMKNKDIMDGIKIYRVEDWINNLNDIMANQRNYNGYFFTNIANKISWLTMKISRWIDYHIYTKICKNQDGFINKRLAIELGKDLNKKNKYDCIISLSYPFVMHEIAYQIKKYDSKVKWYAYQFDPFALNTTLNIKNYKSRLKKEIKILSGADKIFLPEENFKQNMKTALSKLENKYIPFPYALIKENQELIKDEEEKDYISIVFAGTLYEKIREPQRVLDFFYLLKQKGINYKLDFYYMTVQEIEKILQNYKKKLGDNIVLHSNQSKETCDKACYNADILINIGNITPNQTPSKIFENISMCKPIVNFHSIDEDTSKKQLKKYEMSLNIDTRKEYTEENIEEFLEFCLKNKGKIVDFKEATKNFLKADEVAKKFIKIIGENNAKD